MRGCRSTEQIRQLHGMPKNLHNEPRHECDGAKENDGEHWMYTMRKLR